MITVITKIVYPYKEFTNKDEFKTFMVDNYVPEDTDPLRKYNFKLMDKYGHCFFNLVFQKPNIGILYHRYHTQEEYEGSIKLREQQKKHMNSNDIQYKYEIKDNIPIMNEEEYVNLHKQNLQPTNIKINVDKFL